MASSSIRETKGLKFRLATFAAPLKGPRSSASFYNTLPRDLEFLQKVLNTMTPRLERKQSQDNIDSRFLLSHMLKLQASQAQDLCLLCIINVLCNSSIKWLKK